MCPVVVVMADVFRHEALEMTFVQHDYMVEQVSPTVTGEAFCDAILPWAAEAGLLRNDTEAPYRTHQFLIELRPAIKDQVLR